MEGNGSNGSALAVVEPSHSADANVGVLMRRATDVAGVCGQIVKSTAVTIQGRKFVRCEGWQSIAVAYGCVASARDVEKIEGGIRAIGEVRRMSDGAVIATAEGFVGFDEKTWQGRPEYAQRAMAQTRAISRVCRSAFAFVVTLIDSNLSTTPYEEADFMTEGSVNPPPPVVRGNAAVRNALRPTPPKAAEPPPHTDADFRQDAPPHDAKTGEVKHDRDFVMPFANKEQQPLRELSEKSLHWFRKALIENIGDPSKARFVDKARQHLDLINAEMACRGI